MLSLFDLKRKLLLHIRLCGYACICLYRHIHIYTYTYTESKEIFTLSYSPLLLLVLNFSIH